TIVHGGQTGRSRSGGGSVCRSPAVAHAEHGGGSEKKDRRHAPEDRAVTAGEAVGNTGGYRGEGTGKGQHRGERALDGAIVSAAKKLGDEPRAHEGPNSAPCPEQEHREQ